MKNLNLDQLLDNDHLTAAQEIQIRQLCKYQVFLMLGKIKASIQYKHIPYPREFLIGIPRRKENILMTYKRLMENMIYETAAHVSFKDAGKAVEGLILSDPWVSQRPCQKEQQKLVFKEENIVHLPDATEISAQTLFLILKAMLPNQFAKKSVKNAMKQSFG